MLVEIIQKTCWVLKCDIKKFFASIDQNLLIQIVKKYVSNPEIILLLERVIYSFQSTGVGKGMPLGNLTSQLLVNVYMNEFDQFMKHMLKSKYYIRYADDFVILHENKEYLQGLLKEIDMFLKTELLLTLHPDKIFIKTLASGVDFLGWVHFPNHRVLRTATKKRMFRNIKMNEGKIGTVQSYLGMLKHGNAKRLESKIKQFN